ncbi:hypothetical protein KDA_40900 [Dictyobacter alpinus]|uniref:CAAX prenyl protease 2/Lysostaphin resistance protein A-like domain-containing protein n=1 Tax=Dictyobacter alpinus TaxID=2014873 RepID=A0A402BBC2_9CHLR|nr:hypothetical protein KDA_40900 [Dictyobacter alpinus]
MTTFYILAFALAWCIKIPVVLSNTNNFALRLLPSFLPALTALVITAIIAGPRGVGELLKQAGRWRVSPVWYLVALIGPMLLNLLALILPIPFGWTFPSFAFVGILLLPKIVVGTFFSLGEELGWRGFALPRLQSYYGTLTASLLVGLLWWGWHLPEVMAAAQAGLTWQQSAGLLGRDLVLDLAASILMTWIYNRSGHSVLLTTLFHLSIGLLGQFLAIPNPPYVSLVSVLLNVLLCLAAIAVLVLTRLTSSITKKAVTTEVPG